MCYCINMHSILNPLKDDLAFVVYVHIDNMILV
jgi:hypothetical protein